MARELSFPDSIKPRGSYTSFLSYLYICLVLYIWIHNMRVCLYICLSSTILVLVYVLTVELNFRISDPLSLSDHECIFSVSHHNLPCVWEHIVCLFSLCFFYEFDLFVGIVDLFFYLQIDLPDLFVSCRNFGSSFIWFMFY